MYINFIDNYTVESWLVGSIPFYPMDDETFR